MNDLERMVIEWHDAELAYVLMITERKGENRDEITNRLYSAKNALLSYARGLKVKYGPNHIQGN